MNTAVILNVQRFSVQDGPGIRTSVFFKGCPLHCPWCHNPESMESRPELALKAERCLGCEACSPVCPENEAGPMNPATKRPGEICLRCGACADACPSGARDLLGWRTNVPDLVAELERDRPYYEESGGGVTFSGGEPASPENAAFLIDCLDACAASGLHRVVDTCGHVPADTLRAVADRADLLLYDLKIMDTDRHRKTVGVGNELIHGNLKALATAGCPLWIRVPLIPGLTDDEANLLALGGFVASLDRPVPVYLLPHHGGAGEKYRRLGLTDSLAGVATPDAALVDEKAELIRSRGVEVIAGG
jgi:pyruvate formate lyase activating enzyme